MIRFFLLLCFSITFLLTAVEPSEKKIKALYNSLNPKSISQHLAFYEIYSTHPLGQQALRDASKLLSGGEQWRYDNSTVDQSLSGFNAIIALINKATDQDPPSFNSNDLALIEKLSQRLSHHRLLGHKATTEEEVILLPIDEIDIARGIFLSQFGSNLAQVRLYEATIDLMALQILAQLPPQATPEIKIQVMNRFIFDEMHFRFPPHSEYAKDIDLYTFLPSVLDSHRGVCLGVSILYMCLAQRLDLPLEMITPPGHIYVRYHDGDKEINIETTARGVHVDSEEYLGINTRSLEQRNVKEVIGLAHVNQAAAFWRKDDYASALKAYQKATPYLPHDYLLKELKGYTYIALGEPEQGRFYLEQVKDFIPEHSIKKDSTPEDYLNGKVSSNGIKAIFKSVDEDRKSILEKKDFLEAVVKECPEFRSGLLQLAVTWLQLHRMGEALDILNRYHQLDAEDPEVNYYLTILYAQRFDYGRAWDHFHQLEKILHAKEYAPKLLKDVRRQLNQFSPE